MINIINEIKQSFEVCELTRKGGENDFTTIKIKGFLKITHFEVWGWHPEGDKSRYIVRVFKMGATETVPLLAQEDLTEVEALTLINDILYKYVPLEKEKEINFFETWFTILKVLLFMVFVLSSVKFIELFL